MTVSPRTADAVRKVVAYGLAGVATVSLLRVLHRLAHGRLAWSDADLWWFAGIGGVVVAWVVAAKPVRRTGEEREEVPAKVPPQNGPEER